MLFIAAERRGIAKDVDGRFENKSFQSWERQGFRLLSQETGSPTLPRLGKTRQVFLPLPRALTAFSASPAKGNQASVTAPVPKGEIETRRGVEGGAVGGVD